MDVKREWVVWNEPALKTIEASVGRHLRGGAKLNLFNDQLIGMTNDGSPFVQESEEGGSKDFALKLELEANV